MTGYESKRAAAQAKTIDEVNWADHEPNGLTQPEEEKLHPVSIGVDVTQAGTTVTAFYRKPDAVMEMFYTQFHPMPQPAQEPVAWQWLGSAHFRKKLPKNADITAWNPIYTAPPQPAQEPVGKVTEITDNGFKCEFNQRLAAGTKLYTTPPQRTWVGLEGEEIRYLWGEATKPDRSTMAMVTSFAQAIEAALRNKNT